MSQVTGKAKTAAKTNKVPSSLVKCEVAVENGKWISPSSCAKFQIDEDAKFPEIVFEIDTSNAGPFHWSWELKWSVLACPQKKGKSRFKPRKTKTYIERGEFSSLSKRWHADLKGLIIGGELTVLVKVGASLFMRKAIIGGMEPGFDRISAELSLFLESHPKEVALAKRIFIQETNCKHFYSDEQPLVSFDNGYGLGQATEPIPTFEQVWNWKKHVEYIVTNVIAGKRALARKYLEKHGNYTDDDLDAETLVFYNGANYHYLIWDNMQMKWVKNERILCDPQQSNTGWDLKSIENQKKTLEQLREGEGGKPRYTGRCYAEHILRREEEKK